MQASRITKIAGMTLAGFVAASVVADRMPLNSVATQIAGFAGAFLGTLAAHRRKRTPPPPATEAPASGSISPNERDQKHQPS